ncbi:MAG: right-handed parallel beta-helix repeat-containing protein [Candidatus Latescibacteria bacterium]|jgi:hypothetical protein|nr:right-handed parallel beta-helix repeat-containing protein [Candidatus Latescibacterota bacterium]MBT5830996.1 right-handed parallel beta-helix repeat-containing protein [Candidatus Latescibacterota bacterium]
MITFFISPEGNDKANGTSSDHPFATLNHAQSAVNQHAGKAPITVYLREGTYTQNQTFTLAEQDSGSPSAPIIYRPYKHETVRIVGNRTQTDNQHTQISPLVSLDNVHHITFQNLVFESTSGDGIVIKEGANNQIVDCSIRELNNTGIIIDGGQNHILQSCNINHTSNSGIRIHGGDRLTLTHSDHKVDNCHLHHTSQDTKAKEPAIRVSGVGIQISHNHIHDCLHNAISLSGNEHLIEYNRIHNVCLTSDDTGAIHMGDDWTERGIRIQYNFFHDIESIGIQMNNCASGSLILKNVFARCTNAVFIGGGRNHRIDNNIFFQCEPALQIDGRGLDTDPRWHDLIYTILKARFEAQNPLEPPYSQKYPELREVAMYYQAENGIPPEGNIALRNIVDQSTYHHIHWHATQNMIAIQNNLIYEDPHFIDSDNGNYQLQEDSPAYEIGIKPIPFEQMGLYNDAFRQAT